LLYLNKLIGYTNTGIFINKLYNLKNIPEKQTITYNTNFNYFEFSKIKNEYNSRFEKKLNEIHPLFFLIDSTLNNKYNFSTNSPIYLEINKIANIFNLTYFNSYIFYLKNLKNNVLKNKINYINKNLIKKIMKYLNYILNFKYSNNSENKHQMIKKIINNSNHRINNTNSSFNYFKTFTTKSINENLKYSKKYKILYENKKKINIFKNWILIKQNNTNTNTIFQKLLKIRNTNKMYKNIINYNIFDKFQYFNTINNNIKYSMNKKILNYILKTEFVTMNNLTKRILVVNKNKFLDIGMQKDEFKKILLIFENFNSYEIIRDMGDDKYYKIFAEISKNKLLKIMETFITKIIDNTIYNEIKNIKNNKNTYINITNIINSQNIFKNIFIKIKNNKIKSVIFVLEDKKAYVFYLNKQCDGYNGYIKKYKNLNGIDVDLIKYFKTNKKNSKNEYKKKLSTVVGFDIKNLPNNIIKKFRNSHYKYFYDLDSINSKYFNSIEDNEYINNY
jgi:hypothetical protein